MIENEVEKIIKMSFRSKGSFDVNKFAKKYFNGGGHINAAGGVSSLTLDETVEQFIKVIAEKNHNFMVRITFLLISSLILLGCQNIEPRRPSIYKRRFS